MAPPWVLVMLQPDLGTSLVLVAILAGMLFMSGASLRWLLAMAIGGASRCIPVAWTYVLRDYQKDRILSFLNPTQPTRRARAGRCSSRRSRSARAACSARG